VLLLALRLTGAFLIELAPQEAYYWNYAMHPALGYFDHPPAVAWVIRAGYEVVGKSEIGVRIGGYVLTLLSTGLLYLLAKLWFSKRAGLWAAFLFQIVPLFLVYGMLITPDVPLTFFWLLTLYLVSRAVREARSGLWYYAGGSLGLAFLSKYSAAFLVLSTCLFLLCDPRYRFWLRRKEPYLALAIAAIFFTPVVLWNMEPGWASFKFQVSDRLAVQANNPLRRFSEYVLIQLGVTSPMFIAALLLIGAVPRSLPWQPRRGAWRFALAFSLPLLLFLLAYGSRATVKANWPLPGYLPLLLAAYPAYRYLRFGSGQRMRIAARRLLVCWLCAMPLLYGVAIYHLTKTLPHVKVHRWTTGWRELGKLVGSHARVLEQESSQKVFLLGLDTHYLASALSFYAEGGYPVFSRNLIGRPALAFAYWGAATEPRGMNALAIDVNEPDPSKLRPYFERVDEQVTRVPVMLGERRLYDFYLVKCYGYKGIGAAQKKLSSGSD